jgi:hypothetical protein
MRDRRRRDILDDAVAPLATRPGGPTIATRDTDARNALHMSGALASLAAPGGCEFRSRRADLRPRAGGSPLTSRAASAASGCRARGIMRDSTSSRGCTGSFLPVSPRPSRASRVGGVSILPGLAHDPTGRTVLLSPSTDSMTDNQRVAALYELDYALEY